MHRGHYRYKYMTDRMDASVEKPSGPADMEVSSDKLFCCRGVRNKVPLTYREELYHILRMTGPLLILILSAYTFLPVRRCVM